MSADQNHPRRHFDARRLCPGDRLSALAALALRGAEPFADATYNRAS